MGAYRVKALLPVAIGRISIFSMSNTQSDHWFLRKHEDRAVFGPVPFSQILEWARSAQVAPHDSVSEDAVVWTKAPMIPELEMDWLVQLGEELFYGPTTSQSVLEFLATGEITTDTVVINCKAGTEQKLKECEFFPGEASAIEPEPQPARGAIRANLQRRIRELESLIVERQRRLVVAEETIRKLETKVRELEARIRDFSGFKTSKS